MRAFFSRSLALMAKKKSSTPPETLLLLPRPPSAAPIVDTHTHLASTYDVYRTRYKDAHHSTVFDLIRALYQNRHIEALIDVWCEAPVRNIWREIADSALTPEDRMLKWGGIDYWFVMGVHPHEAQHYTDDIENDIIAAMSHPRCVGWGEMGLDYHYDNSPRDIQRAVFRRQLKHAVNLDKPLTIHTREADADTEMILKDQVPKDHKIHIHCFTDSPDFAQRLLDHFPNLYIGITGVITYSTNSDTSTVIKNMISTSPLRILLETDAPYMVPANLYNSIPDLKGKRLPISHSAMIPWTADFVAGLLSILFLRFLLVPFLLRQCLVSFPSFISTSFFLLNFDVIAMVSGMPGAANRRSMSVGLYLRHIGFIPKKHGSVTVVVAVEEFFEDACVCRILLRAY